MYSTKREEVTKQIFIGLTGRVTSKIQKEEIRREIANEEALLNLYTPVYDIDMEYKQSRNRIRAKINRHLCNRLLYGHF